MNALLPSKSRKVVVVGAGAVGSTYCYALAQSGIDLPARLRQELSPRGRTAFVEPAQVLGKAGLGQEALQPVLRFVRDALQRFSQPGKT